MLGYQHLADVGTGPKRFRYRCSAFGCFLRCPSVDEFERVLSENTFQVKSLFGWNPILWMEGFLCFFFLIMGKKTHLKGTCMTVRKL